MSRELGLALGMVLSVLTVHNAAAGDARIAEMKFNPILMTALHGNAASKNSLKAPMRPEVAFTRGLLGTVGGGLAGGGTLLALAKVSQVAPTRRYLMLTSAHGMLGGGMGAGLNRIFCDTGYLPPEASLPVSVFASGTLNTVSVFAAVLGHSPQSLSWTERLSRAKAIARRSVLPNFFGAAFGTIAVEIALEAMG